METIASSNPNGISVAYTYDELNRITRLSTPPVADYKYTLGLAGNRSNATEQYLTIAANNPTPT